jgi:hypothetical protein
MRKKGDSTKGKEASAQQVDCNACAHFFITWDKRFPYGCKETSTAAAVTSYETQLLDLNERLETIKSRYLSQFVAMESLVQRSKNTGEYLSGQFKAMENMYSRD